MPTPQGPASNPTLPNGFDIFNPDLPTGVTTNSGAPGIAQWTQSGGPGNTISVSITNPSALPSADNDSDTQFITYGQTNGSNGSLNADTIEQMTGGVASVNLSSLNASNSMYMLWAENADGFSAPVEINKTTAWWIGPNAAGPGQTVSIYGQNLTFSSTDGLSWVYITKAGSSTGQWASVSSANPYQVSFVVPTNLTAGNYQVWVHNGHGGEYGWSSPMTLNVAPQYAYTGPTVNALNYGAVGNGITDDTSAFNAALSAIANSPGGATLYVPAGTYLVSSLNLPYNVQLIGAGQGQTIIEENPANSSNLPSQVLLFGSNNQISNLTVSTNNVNVAYAVSGIGQSNVHFTNVTFNGGQGGFFDFNQDTNIFLQGCTMIGDGGFLGSAAQVFINQCNFFATNDADSLLFSWGGSDISITNCTAQDYSDSNPNSGAGWGQGRFFVGSDIWGSQTNTYIANNTTTALGVRPTYANQNAGEQLLWEGQSLYGAYFGSTANTVTISNLPSEAGPGYYAVIVAGDGVGEYEPLASYNATTGVATLATPWLVTPDATSVVRVGEIFTNIVVYNNTLQGKGVTNTASTGVQFWGGAINDIIDSNNISNTREGIVVAAMSGTYDVIPNYFVTIQNNSITNVQTGVEVWNASLNNEIGSVGVVLRSNNFNTVSQVAIYLRNVDSMLNPFDVIAEYNTATNTVTGVSAPQFGTATTYLVLNDNTFSLGNATYSGSTALSIGQPLVLVQTGNKYSGFQQTYGGTVSPTFATLPQTPAVAIPALQTSTGGSYTISGIPGAEVLDITSGTVILGIDLSAFLGNYTLEIQAGATVVLAGNQHIGSLQIAPGGTLDVGTCAIYVDYGANPDPKTTILQYLKSGYNGGAWNGTGIDSSAAAGNSNYGVGFGDGADQITSHLASGQIEIAYAMYGDVNLNNIVDGTDQGIVSTNLNKGVSGGWEDGDFTYSGNVNGIDLGYVNTNNGKGAVITPQTVPGLTSLPGAQYTLTNTNGTEVLDITSGTVVLSADISADLGSYTLKIENGAKVVLAGNQHLGQLILNGNGTLDVGAYAAFVDYGANPDPKTTILQYLKSGRNGGAWNGTGIDSSAAAKNSSYGVGFADGADGVDKSLVSGQIEITFALYGDANLDGVADGTDFAIVAGNLNKGVPNGWEDGDFTYSGTVDGTDFGYVGGNLNKGSSASVAVNNPPSQTGSSGPTVAPSGTATTTDPTATTINLSPKLVAASTTNLLNANSSPTSDSSSSDSATSSLATTSNVNFGRPKRTRHIK